MATHFTIAANYILYPDRSYQNNLYAQECVLVISD